MFEEKVQVCDEGLKKVCDEKTVGKGEEICKTHYETTCETRFEIGIVVLGFLKNIFKVQRTWH